MYHSIMLHSVELITVLINTYKFHVYAPVEDLVNDCIAKLPELLVKYNPRKNCFTFLSVSFKRFLIKHTAKMKLRAATQKTMSSIRPPSSAEDDAYASPTSEYTDGILADTDPGELRESEKGELRSALEQLTVRYFDEESHKILLYYIDTLTEGSFVSNKVRVSRTAAFMFDASMSKTQFLFDYLHVRLRQAMLDHYVSHIRPLNFLSLPSSLSLVPELVEAIGEDNTMKVIAIFGGIRMLLPTLEDVETLRRELEIYNRIDADSSRENLDRLCRQYRMSRFALDAVHRKVFINLQKIPRKRVVIRSAAGN